MSDSTYIFHPSTADTCLSADSKELWVKHLTVGRFGSIPTLPLSFEISFVLQSTAGLRDCWFLI